MNSTQRLLQTPYSFQSYGFRPIVRYLLVEHSEVFLSNLRALGLTPDELLLGKRTLNASEQQQLWGLAIGLRQSDPLIAFRSALLHDIHDSGLVGALARSCQNMQELFDLHQSYLHKLDSEGVRSQVDFQSSSVSLFFPAFLQAPSFVQEYAVAATWVAETQLSSEVKKHVEALELPGSSAERGLNPQHFQFIEKAYGPVLKLNEKRVAIRFSRSVSEVGFPTADPGLKQLLLKKLRIQIGETLSDDTEELRSQVFTAIWDLHQNQKGATLESIADYLGTNSKKLSYAMRTHGISLQRLKELVGQKGE